MSKTIEFEMNITSKTDIENFIASHRNEILFLERKKEIEVKL